MLNGSYDSFRHGVKCSDRDKIADAAKSAAAIVYEQEEYKWDPETFRFCGALLCRAGLYQPDIFLMGDWYLEAALCYWNWDAYTDCGACAAAALMTPNWNQAEEIPILLTATAYKSRDISGLKILREQVPERVETLLPMMISDLFLEQGIYPAAGQSLEDNLNRLSSIYPNHDIENALRDFISGNPGARPEPGVPIRLNGWISKLNWGEQSGVIVSSDGTNWPFRYQEVSDGVLRKRLGQTHDPASGGKTIWTEFSTRDNKNAIDIMPIESPLELSKKAAAENQLEYAMELCREAAGSPDASEAAGDLVKYAVAISKLENRNEILTDAAAYYEAHQDEYPRDAWHLAALGQLYYGLHELPEAVDYMRQALEQPRTQPRLKLTFLAHAMRYCVQYYNENPDVKLMETTRDWADEWLRLYEEAGLSTESNTRRYYPRVLRWKCRAECELDKPEEAEEAYRLLYASFPSDPHLDELRESIRKARRRVNPEPENNNNNNLNNNINNINPAPENNININLENNNINNNNNLENNNNINNIDNNNLNNNINSGTEKPEENNNFNYNWENAENRVFENNIINNNNDDEEDMETVPYEDKEGWDALHMTRREAIDTALSFTGPGAVPAAAAWLKAASDLNPEILPAYKSIALAAHDINAAPDYSVSALLGSLGAGDPDYPVFTDHCMAAAFLRTAFLSGREYDYNAKSLRDSITVAQDLPALRDIYDTLEEFRAATGVAFDIYAEYRNQDAKKLQEELDGVVSYADELYQKFIATVPRESVKFKRLLETKKILFSRDGYLARILRHVTERDQTALEKEKQNFADRFLEGDMDFASKKIGVVPIDGLIEEAWVQAVRNLQVKKVNSTLQGNRRNNIRSSISEILGVVCQWYALTDQGAGISHRTEAGEEVYNKLKPRLSGQLEELAAWCLEARERGDLDAETRMGLELIGFTAKELSMRVNGGWHFGQEKYLYAEFLYSDEIILDEDFSPDLSSSFCALPEFNILARIQRHLKERDEDLQAHLDKIYGPDKFKNNYGTADRIINYCAVTGQEVRRPENADQFAAQSEMQTRMRFRAFQESYALAMNCGQIMRSDAFCYNLLDTARYWYAESLRNKNFGFFTSFLRHSEERIHASAGQYGRQLEEQLDALLSANQEEFDRHPGYADAIQTQIEQQNFIVAEDWMQRIRLGDFSLDVQKPEALVYLEDFWNHYVECYRRMADTGRSVGILMGRARIRNKDAKGAQRLIDCWLNNGSPSSPARIAQFLDLLGWHDLKVEQYNLDNRTEIYRATRGKRTDRMSAPPHPIAAFGSKLDRENMYIACLYGAYNCDRLYEKIRALDSLDGGKIILIDYALGGADRRALARKLKEKENGLRNVYLIIDRVLLCHLADVYNESLINKILMAVGIPFSYCQPYVVESSHTMPPEIFIGRKDELLKIEQPDGVNLIYGGRQLGKSALFKKARGDLDGNQGRRAVFVDIHDCGCSDAARRLSRELSEINILDNIITDDWEALCYAIRARLRSRDDIKYLLIMLDEADSFITDCGEYNYKPLAELKDVQQALPGQFKFVLAGLHNIVRFNREVALGRNSVITHLPSLKITPFRTPEAQELLTGPLSYLGLSLPDKVTVSQILATVNYFPGLIQLYCQKLVESLRAADYAGYDVKNTPPYVITAEHLRRVMADREFVEQIHEKFEITLRLDQDQGGSYYPLTLLIGYMYSEEPSKVKSGYGAKDVSRYAEQWNITQLKNLGEEKIDALMQELQDLNILRGIGPDTYLLASKNFRDLLGSDDEIFEKLSKIAEASA